MKLYTENYSCFLSKLYFLKEISYYCYRSCLWIYFIKYTNPYYILFNKFLYLMFFLACIIV